MREDIVGMLKNAIERGGRPEQIARSLVNSGYNAAEVQQALSFVTGGTLSSLNAPPQQPVNIRPMAQMPQQINSQIPPQPTQYPSVAQQQTNQYARPLPISPQQYSGPGSAKLMVLIATLLMLVVGLISAIIFKDEIINLFG